jgi:hypothetical protein
VNNDSAPGDHSREIYDSLKVLTIDRAGNGEWLPVETARLLTAKGIATVRGSSRATLLLFLDGE